jgi:hypothetical protein
MVKKAKRKKIAKKAPKKVARKKAVKKAAKKAPKKAARRAMLSSRFCFNMTADPNVVIRCEVGPDGRCNRNCVAIPISQMPSSAQLRKRIKRI